MNTGLLVLLIIPLLGASEPPQNINDLSIWLAKWYVQQVEFNDELRDGVNSIGLDTVKNWLLVDFANNTIQQIALLQKDVEILKGRLSVAAIFSSVYMIISSLCMIVYLAVFVKKCVKKHQLKRQEEEIELMDQKLQERRERRRAAARAKSSSPRQQ